MSIDVSERNQAESSLRASEELFRLVWENAADGLRLADAEGRIVAVNEAYCRMVGKSRSEVQGQFLFSLFAAPDQGRYQERYQEWFANRDIPTYLERQLTLWDGRQLRVETSNCFIETDPARPLLLSIFRDVTDRIRTDEQLRQSLEEKNALLKEVHHRVKNNLQIITSLLHLQASKIRDPVIRAALADSQNRVRSMALVHESLDGSRHFGRIDLGDYLNRLCSQLADSFGADPTRLQMSIDAMSTNVELEKAITCGLIVNELVCNSLKYAFPKEQRGRIHVSLTREDGQDYTLQITDDGIGLPSDIHLNHPQSLGLQLVRDLANQLDGRLTCD